MGGVDKNGFGIKVWWACVAGEGRATSWGQLCVILFINIAAVIRDMEVEIGMLLKMQRIEYRDGWGVVMLQMVFVRELRFFL